MRSWLNMSIVLYALGAALFAWSGFMLLGGDTFATIDIAASLAGWGAFTVGLGAVTGALRKLTRAVVDGRQSPLAANASAEQGRRSDVVPVFVARGKEPAHFEPQPQPIADPGSVAEPDPSPAPQPFRAPEPELQPAKAAVSVVRPPARSDDRDAAELSKKERRARRLQARQEAAEAEGGDGAVEAPVIAAPALGGRLMPRATVPAFDAPSSPAARGEGRAPAPVDRTPQPAIIPVRRPEPEPPVDEPSAPFPAAAAPLDAENDAPSAPATAPAPEPEEAPATPAVSLPDPKVPEWLARARARREARSATTPAKAAFVAAASVAEPQPEPAPQETESEPVPAEPEAGEPKPPQLEEAESLAGEPQAAEPEFAEAPAAEAEAEAESAEPEEAEPPPAEFGASEPYTAAEPLLVREGEHKGVLYRFYDDGSVEAISSFGVRRFATVDELRDTVVAARGGDEFGSTEDAEAAVEEAPSSEPEPEPGRDALDAALAELETAPPTAAPELRIDPSDRPDRR